MFWMRKGKILASSKGKILDTKKNCCCGGTSCPTDCTGCPALALTVVFPAPWAIANIVGESMFYDDACGWSLSWDDVTFDAFAYLRCSGGRWILHVEIGSAGGSCAWDSIGRPSDTCPPTGAYIQLPQPCSVGVPVTTIA